jgi:hypothetical protein
MTRRTLINKIAPAAKPKRRPYWEVKTLAQMTQRQWENLCDGCGKCCLIGLEDADTGEIYLTDVACKMFDAGACRCSDYENRQARVPDCVKLTPENVPTLTWLPKTCAYRLVSEKRPLYWWHPLVSGDPETVHAANVSVRGKVRSEETVKTRNLIRRVTQWPAPARKPRGKAKKGA